MLLWFPKARLLSLETKPREIAKPISLTLPQSFWLEFSSSNLHLWLVSSWTGAEEGTSLDSSWSARYHQQDWPLEEDGILCLLVSPEITLPLSRQILGRSPEETCTNNLPSLLFTSLHSFIENPGTGLETELIGRHKIIILETQFQWQCFCNTPSTWKGNRLNHP